jgi:hypothetical protein
MRNVPLSDKELVLLYMLLRGDECPDEKARAQLISRVEKTIFEFMTIEDVEHITDFFHSL